MLRPIVRRLDDHALKMQPTAKWLVLSILVGIVAGAGAIPFQVAGQAVAHIGLERIAGFKPEEAAGERRTFPEPAVATDFSPLRLILVLAVGGLVSRQPLTPRQVHRVKHFAKHIKLELFMRLVAATDRMRAFISRQPRQRELGQSSFSRQAVHDVGL